RAASTAAYHTALAWLQAGARLLATDGWSEHRELTAEVHLELAVAASMTGNASALEQSVSAVRAHARTTYETARALDVVVGDHVMRGRFTEAVTVGREALA